MKQDFIQLRNERPSAAGLAKAVAEQELVEVIASPEQSDIRLVSETPYSLAADEVTYLSFHKVKSKPNEDLPL